MCQETQDPNCDFQCLRSQQVYLEFKSIQQTQWYPIGRADRCSLSQTCYKYKNVSVRLLEYSECLERRHTVVCQRVLGQFLPSVIWVLTTSSPHSMFLQLYSSPSAVAHLLSETTLFADVWEMLPGRTSSVSVIVISCGQYQNPRGLLNLLFLDLPKQCA